jgi:hypothetical protein
MPSLTTTPDVVVPAQREWKWTGVLAPSLVDCFFAALLAWLFIGGGGKMLLSDGDTGWHIRTGDYILEHHAVPRTDLFTFTKPDEPWFAWEWLTDVLFSSLHSAWGLKAISLVAGLALCGAATLVFCRMLWSGGNLFLSLGVALLANGATLVHFLARPHVFTFLLLAGCLWLLARDRRRPDAAIWLLAPITAVWVNLHGGFLSLLICLGLTAAGYGLQWLAGDRERSLFFAQRYVVLGVVCSLATLLNPYGYKLHLHIAGFLQSSFVLNTVEEFQSPQFRGENMLQFEALLFAGIALAGTLLAKKRFVEAVLILFWAQASLTSVRHAPIFVIVAAPILVEELSGVWNRWSRHKSRNSIGGILRDLGNEFSRAGLRATVWAPLLVFALAVSMAKGSPDTWPREFPKVKFPISTIEQYSALLAPTTKPMPRIFTSDQWADYLSYRFYPRMRIFVDGRSDFFGPVIGKEYVSVASGRSEWESILNRYRIDVALVPVEWPLAELLKRNTEWRLLKDDKSAILFERRTPVLMKTEVSAESSNSFKRSTLP